MIASLPFLRGKTSSERLSNRHPAKNWRSQDLYPHHQPVESWKKPGPGCELDHPFGFFL